MSTVPSPSLAAAVPPVSPTPPPATTATATAAASFLARMRTPSSCTGSEVAWSVAGAEGREVFRSGPKPAAPLPPGRPGLGAPARPERPAPGEQAKLPPLEHRSET
ncbi:hypothetical protein GCM10009801_65000 [Streptomyces albiaxialis]|uniref:Uncharacterized protein n=1 Tax=Streptomyces albiaxialis TaxID=329523 RepID=A0ABN2WN81_9ACTN